jgi:hypothetical protein
MTITTVALSNTFNEFRTSVNDVITTLNAGFGSSAGTGTGLTSGRVVLGGTSGAFTDDATLTYNTSTDVLTLGGTTDASAANNGTLVVSGGVGIAKKLYVGTDLRVTGITTFEGNVFFLGSNTEVSTTQLNLNDSLIQLANNNTTDAVDIGVFGMYDQGSGNVHSGIFRDASDDTWKLFRNYNIEPSSTINVAANGFAWANLAIGALSAANSINIGSGQTYKINTVDILSATTLGSSVVTSSLTSTGTITSGTWSGSFGAVSGANLTSLNANNIATGTVATARLASGTADATTFLRGDSTWASAAVSITNNITTDATFYPVFTSVTTGSIVGANTSSTKLTFNPSSGLLTSTDYNSSSDVTLKENFTQIVNPLDIISQLDGFGFSWKDTKEKSYGLSAQQVETVLPDIVRVRPDGTKGINYLNLIAFLVEGIKDLKEEVRQLKSYK